MRSGGLRVYTTIDPRLQRAARKAINDTLYLRNDPAAAVVAINPATGAIRAMTAVSPGRTGNQFNLIAQAHRQAGSTFKTFVLTTAIEQGMDPDSTYYLSAPFHYQPDPYTPAWDVSTYDHSYSGAISVAQRDAALGQHRVRAADARRRAGERRARWRTSSESARTLDVGYVPSMGLGVDRGDAARHGVGVRDARRGRHLLEADGDPQGRARQRQGRHRRRLGQAAAEARDLATASRTR